MQTVRLPGVGPQALLDALKILIAGCQNIRGAGGTAWERFDAYRHWSNDAARCLAHLARPRDVERLVTTARYWALQALDPTSHGNLAGLVDLEVDARNRDLTAAAEALDAGIARRAAYRGLSNVYLHHEQRFDQIAWASVVPASSDGVHLVIPLVVVDELDRHKRTDRQTKVQRGLDETVGSRARGTLRYLEELFPDPSRVATIAPDREPDAVAVRAELLVDPLGHVRLSDPDAELIDQALALQDLSGQAVTLATRDTGMIFRAKAAGLATART